MKGSVDTPLGPVWVEVEEGDVIASGWGIAEGGDDRGLRAALDEVTAYFDGRLEAFSVPMRPKVSGLSARVLAALAAIPFGETRTYGDLSKALGAPAQAIGQACGTNPVPILIPCHRVLGATTLGVFSAPGGVEAKVWLLRHEGAAGLLI